MVTIPANESSATFNVVPIADATSEPDEDVLATLVDYFGGYGIGSPDTATLIISDGTTGLPVVTVQATDDTASEAGQDTANFTFTRTGGNLNQGLTVSFDLTGSATSSDYTLDATGGQVSFISGSATAMVVLTPVQDDDPEGTETVTLTISPSGNYTRGTPFSGEASISDDDVPPAPSAPANLVVSAEGAYRVSLSWSEPAGDTPSGYNIYRSTTSSFAIGTSTWIAADVVETNYTDLTVDGQTQYYYRVTALNAEGNESAASSSAGDTTWVPHSESWGLAAFRPALGQGFEAAIDDATEETDGSFLPFNILGEADFLTKVVLKRRSADDIHTLSRTTGDITVWADAARTQQILGSNTGDSATATFSGGDTQTVWVEWSSLGLNESFLQLSAESPSGLLAAAAQPATDQVRFKRTTTHVVLFAGHTQSDDDEQLKHEPEKNTGIWRIGTILQRAGYTVKMFSEDPGNRVAAFIDDCGEGVDNAFQYLMDRRIANETMNVALVLRHTWTDG